jgi:hypothetical protein
MYLHQYMMSVTSDLLPVFLGKAGWRVVQKVKHKFRRAAEPGAFWRHHKWPVDQNRVGDHGVNDKII